MKPVAQTGFFLILVLALVVVASGCKRARYEIVNKPKPTADKTTQAPQFQPPAGPAAEPLHVKYFFEATPANAQVGQPVKMKAHCTATLPVKIAWDFGDGAVGDGIETQHSFAKAGTFRVESTCSIGDGRDVSSAVTITVTAP